MEIACVQQKDGVWYDWRSVEEALCVENEPCAFQLRFEQCPVVLCVDGYWIARKSFVAFLNWLSSEVTCEQRAVIRAANRALCSTGRGDRRTARKLRWEIAWRQEYKCADCGELLHPRAMDIDHIVPLHAGGEDVAQNLQALCANCHAKKTRTNV
jgi:5-methylcytosine-specific restriction endonuclease McrA